MVTYNSLIDPTYGRWFVVLSNTTVDGVVFSLRYGSDVVSITKMGGVVFSLQCGWDEVWLDQGDCYSLDPCEVRVACRPRCQSLQAQVLTSISLGANL